MHNNYATYTSAYGLLTTGLYQNVIFNCDPLSENPPLSHIPQIPSYCISVI